MSYAVSQLDRDSFQWFANDKSRNSLVGIKVDNGSIRGIYPCKIDFSYPISSFVGENGSGKSTLLALSPFITMTHFINLQEKRAILLMVIFLLSRQPKLDFKE